MNHIEELVLKMGRRVFRAAAGDGGLLLHDPDFLKLVKLAKGFREYCWLCDKDETLNIEERVTGEVDPFRDRPPE